MRMNRLLSEALAGAAVEISASIWNKVLAMMTFGMTALAFAAMTFFHLAKPVVRSASDSACNYR